MIKLSIHFFFGLLKMIIVNKAEEKKGFQKFGKGKCKGILVNLQVFLSNIYTKLVITYVSFVSLS